jgi:hypothetical protein
MRGSPGDLLGNAEPRQYPDAPGFKGTAETGREAAEAIAPKCGRLQRLTLQAIIAAGPAGRTADEAAERCGMDRWSIQPRVSELKAKGLIKDSGLRRPNVTGRNAVVWVTPEHRREVA